MPELYDSARPPTVGRVRRVARWWMGSTRTLIVSAVFASVIVAMGVYLLLVPAPVSTTTAQGADTTPPATSVSTSESAAASTPAVSCPAQKAQTVEPETLVLTSYSTQWYPVSAMLAPRSKTGGPGRPGDRRCFARSPEGALYAVATRTVEQAADAGVTGKQLSGYQWLSYSPDLAAVALAARLVNGTGSGLMARTFSARWVDNDWQVSVLNQPVQTLDGLRTFTPWGGA